MHIVASAEGVCNDYTRARASKARLDNAAAAKRDKRSVEAAVKKVGGNADVISTPAAAAAPHAKKKQFRSANLFELASQFGQPVGQETFDPRSPLLVAASLEATAVATGAAKAGSSCNIQGIIQWPERRKG